MTEVTHKFYDMVCYKHHHNHYFRINLPLNEGLHSVVWRDIQKFLGSHASLKGEPRLMLALADKPVVRSRLRRHNRGVTALRQEELSDAVPFLIIPATVNNMRVC